ncbi:MAG TPA: DNA helicase RecQ [Gammaproteobacteria bacterium]|nr:DNA helicase RecQ [Gammaproteobacteria bacterium]
MSSLPLVSATPSLESARHVLRETFGYPAFRGQQEQIIAAALAGRDSLVLMPTGGGKSLCYQIPSLVREGVGVVVSPLIALMEDQVGALREAGVAAAYLNSTLRPAEQRAVIGALRAGELKLLYLAPERLLQPETLDLLQQVPVALIAIDEAHCVSQWGHDFRAEYLALAVLKQRFPGVPRMALTATATVPTREEIVARLELTAPEVFVSSFDRPNIRYSVRSKTDARRQLLDFLQGHRGEAGIVYCLSRNKTESVAEWLSGQGFPAVAYHAGLSNEQRTANQRRFLNEDGLIVVATIAFGMGIDKPDVRFVAHLDLPKSVESYYQETGRAGRDGEPAEAWMVYGLQDVVQLRALVEGSSADEAHKRNEVRKLDALLGWCEVTECRRRPLLGYFGERLEADCGNCDNCLSPPATFDGTEPARKLLSAVYRTGQMFGAAHVIDVLLGNATEKVQRHRHESLSVFGIGADLPVQTWRSLLRQLIVRGYLQVDHARYGALVLTDQSRPLLRGEAQLRVREDTRAAPAARRKSGAAAEVGLTPADEPLWQALRECRKRLAAEHNVPPYVIFHDATLREMLRLRPASRDALLGIAGVGQAKLERYGDDFLAVLRAAG